MIFLNLVIMIMTKFLYKIFYYKNFIIFALVLFFAFQSLYFISLYKINFPYSVDHVGINYLYDYIIYEKFPYEKFFSSYAGHFTIFPRLIVLPNLIFNSFDIINLYYIPWIVLSLSLYLIYLLLKRTDIQLYWLLIPISAFVYSPLINSNYWAFAILQWLLPPLGIITVIFLLDKKINVKTFGTSILAALCSTFSVIAGIVVWLPGIFSFMHYHTIENKWTDKKWLIGWLVSVSIVGLSYYYFVPKSEIEINLSKFFSFEGLSFVTIFLSTAFRLKYHFLMIIVGSITVILSLFCVYYFTILKKKIKIALPWLLFLLIGTTSAFVTALGRVHLDNHYGNEPYYIPMSQFIQIGLIVLISLIILDIRQQQFKYKRFSLFLLSSIIIMHMILLIPSYYSGWWRGNYYYEEKLEFVNCFSLTHGAECVTTHSHGTVGAFKSDLNFDLINYWLKNKMNIFGETNFNNIHRQELEKFSGLLNNKNNLDVGFGKIETINELQVNNNDVVYLDNSFIIINGWTLDSEMKQLDDIFLIVDDRPFLKYNDFQPRLDIKDTFGKNTDINSGWSISFLSGYIEEGCHRLSVIGIKNGSKFTFDQELQICIKK